MKGGQLEFKKFIAKYGLGTLVCVGFFVIVLIILFAILTWMHRERRKQERIDDRRNSMDLLEKGQQGMRPRRDSESSSTEPTSFVSDEINDSGPMSSVEPVAVVKAAPGGAVTETALNGAVATTVSPDAITKTDSSTAAVKTDPPITDAKTDSHVAVARTDSLDSVENPSSLNSSRGLDEPRIKESMPAALPELSSSNSVPNDLPSRTEPPLPSLPDLDESNNESSIMNTQTDLDPYTTQEKRNTPKPTSGWGRT